jgi:hypothetical protein
MEPQGPIFGSLSRGESRHDEYLAGARVRRRRRRRGRSRTKRSLPAGVSQLLRVGPRLSS